jgi:hypothetical protein
MSALEIADKYQISLKAAEAQLRALEKRLHR